ncbi:MAG: alpha/beta hydrolase [Betaproteobacteria bacterium RIFCSPHIGHO2_12_FULL_69_13]|nr:MAG: alpha/beta hydrolase [Betaproteobacteria bacterium RIFCSPHIGHO2_12_FULL_69_13]OGA69708.1 MAG: alpha/beta hydrolase [Betaproteobacteria bacterium RIFCSPLOWO2_12_FULL_68_20]
MSFAQSTLRLDGCNVSLRRGGKGAPLLYLHGAGGAPVVLPFMEQLAERYDVLVPEHPGWGLSDEPEWLENIHDLAYFYLDFLRALDLKNAVLVGSSMGGWLALEMAVRDCSRIRSIVLVGPAGIAAPGVQPADIFLMSPEELTRNLFHDQSFAEKMLAQPITPEMVDIQLKNRHTVARLAWEPRLHDPFLPKWLHRIEVPVKIVWGAEDRILPAAFANEFKRLLPKAEVEIVPQCGHLPQTEKAEQFCDIVFRFAG